MKKNWWKKTMASWLAICLLWQMVGMDALRVRAAVSVSAKACILMEAVTGEVLFEQNARERLPMASTTKIMSTLLCLESGDLDRTFVVDSDAIHVEGSSMGLVEGDIVTKRALCYGMLLPSGNDAAGAAAVEIAGSYAAFADQMNEKAAALGMQDTHFVTPSGLHDPEHYSTAYDMALLTAAAMQNETFRTICRQSTAQVEFGNPPYLRWLQNSNKLLTMDDTIVGVKTGFTDEAGRCLVSACVRNGVMLLCVTLNDKNDWQDHLALYAYGFDQVTPTDISFPTNWQQTVVGGVTETVPVHAETTLCVGTTGTKLPDFTYVLEMQPFLYAPVAAKQRVGTWKALLNGRVAAQGDLYTSEAAAVAPISEDSKKSFSFWETIQKKWNQLWKRIPRFSA